MSETAEVESQNTTTDEASQADKLFGSEVPENKTEQGTQPEAQEKPEGEQNEETQEKLLSESETSDEGDSSKSDEDKAGEDQPKTIELKMPENARIDETALETVKELAEKQGMNGEQAQATLELADTAIKNFEQHNQSQWNERFDNDVKRIKDDKEFGGDHLDESQQHALSVIKRFAPDPEQFLQELKDSRMSDHYSNFVMLARIGKLMAEDGFHVGTQKGAERDNSDAAKADRLFGKK